MAGQGLIRHEADGRYKVVFPFGGEEYEVCFMKTERGAMTVLPMLVPSCKTRQDKTMTVLACLALRAAQLSAELPPSQGGSGSSSGGGGTHSFGQLVQQLQDAVRAWETAEPSLRGLLIGTLLYGHAAVAQLLLLIDPTAARDPDDDVLHWTHRSPLHQAAFAGQACAALFTQLLAQSPEAATALYQHLDLDDYSQWSLMHSAAAGGSVEAIQALLQLVPGIASWQTDLGNTPLHEACQGGRVEAARLLLQLAPGTATATDAAGSNPLHYAARAGKANTAQLLLQSWPGAALTENNVDERPFHCALQAFYPDQGLITARLLLPASGLGASQLLDALAAAPAAFQPLYADLAAHLPLTAEHWQRVPPACAGLGRALPAVLARSDDEAGQLVRRLPADDQQRLRLAALCLARAQRRTHVPLPAPLQHVILAQCLAG